MTCDEVLPLLLDAESDDLSGNAVTPLARHVRECSRCRAVADRFQRETAVLASVVVAGEARRPARRSLPVRAIRWAAPGLAAAAIALLVLARDVPPGTAVPAAAPTLVAAPPIPPASAPTSPALRQSGTAGVIRAQPFTVAPLAGPVAVTAVPVAGVPPARAEPATLVELPEAGPTADSVVVTPARGTSARVARTRNPSITVVWITNTK